MCVGDPPESMTAFRRRSLCSGAHAHLGKCDRERGLASCFARLLGRGYACRIVGGACQLGGLGSRFSRGGDQPNRKVVRLVEEIRIANPIT